MCDNFAVQCVILGSINCALVTEFVSAVLLNKNLYL